MNKIGECQDKNGTTSDLYEKDGKYYRKNPWEKKIQLGKNDQAIILTFRNNDEIHPTYSDADDERQISGPGKIEIEGEEIS